MKSKAFRSKCSSLMPKRKENIYTKKLIQRELNLADDEKEKNCAGKLSESKLQKPPNPPKHLHAKVFFLKR